MAAAIQNHKPDPSTDCGRAGGTPPSRGDALHASDPWRSSSNSSNVPLSPPSSSLTWLTPSAGKGEQAKPSNFNEALSSVKTVSSLPEELSGLDVWSDLWGNRARGPPTTTMKIEKGDGQSAGAWDQYTGTGQKVRQDATVGADSHHRASGSSSAALAAEVP